MNVSSTHLRLHQPPAADNPGRHHVGQPIVRDRDPIDQFWSVFSSATGWRIDAPRRRRGDQINVIPAVNSLLSQDLSIEETDLEGSANRGLLLEPDQGLARDIARELAAAASGVTAELLATRKQLARGEIELAARAMVIATPDRCDDIADRISQHLSDAVAATGTTAAVLYLLDDDTESLRISATMGLPPIVMTTPPRPLRGSRGDLEALVNHVVMTDAFSPGGIDSYTPPELVGGGSFKGGICVSIRSGDLPVGTLWLLHDDAVQYGSSQSAAARLSASAIELELRQSVTEANPDLRHAKHSHATELPSADSPAEKLVREVAHWQFLSLPQGSKLADNWHVDGMIESPADWVSGWHAWDVLPDGTMMIALAELDPSTTVDAIGASVARAALQSHSLYRHDPAQMLRRISDTIWQTGAVQSTLSLLYAHVDPETGNCKFASAGGIRAIIGNRYGFRPIIDGTTPAIGDHVETRFTNQSARLLPGETLLGYDSGLILDDSFGQSSLGQCLRSSAMDSSCYPLAAIRRQLANRPLKRQRGAISLARSV